MSTVTLLTIEIPLRPFEGPAAVISAEWDKGQGYRVRHSAGPITTYPSADAALAAAWRLARSIFKQSREQVQ